MNCTFHFEEDVDEVSLCELIDTVVSDFPLVWRRCWGLDSSDPSRHLEGDSWTDVCELDRIAHRLVAAAADLSSRKLPDDRRTLPAWISAEARLERKEEDELLQQLRAALDQVDGPMRDILQWHIRWSERETPAETRERFFRTSLEIHAFRHFDLRPTHLPERVLSLLSFLVRTKSARAQDYLRRVARCYVLDLGPELAIMSRAAMEAALESLELEWHVAQVQEIRGRRPDKLVNWLEAATRAGLLNEDGRIAAELVRNAGNMAAHDAPGLAPPADQILQSLIAVFEQIEGAEDSTR